MKLREFVESMLGALVVLRGRLSGWQEEVRRSVWSRMKKCLDEEDLRVAEGQPFYLRLIARVLEAAGDCDHEFLVRAETGLPLGVLEQLPRTPRRSGVLRRWTKARRPI